MSDPGYFKDMEIVDNRLKKLEAQMSKVLIVIERLKNLLEKQV